MSEVKLDIWQRCVADVLCRAEHGQGWAGPTPNPRTNRHNIGLQFLGSRTDPVEPGTKDRTNSIGPVRFQGQLETNRLFFYFIFCIP